MLVTSAGMSATLRWAISSDSGAIAAAQRVIARTPGMLASQPHEIHDADIHHKILNLNEQGGGVFLVAEECGAVVGHGLLQAYRLAVTAHVAELTLAVHTGHQGRGVGRLLMLALIDWARACPTVEKIELRVRASNDRAIALYRSLGFVDEGRFRNRIKLGPEVYIDDLSMGLWVGAAPLARAAP